VWDARKVNLSGGTISANKDLGVYADSGVKVTMAEEDGLPQTVCKDNGRYDRYTDDSGEIIGIPQEKIHRG